LAITTLRTSLPSTEGYAAMWLVCGAAILAGLAFVGPLSAEEAQVRNRREQESSALREAAHGVRA